MSDETELRIFTSSGDEVPMPEGTARFMDVSLRPIREASTLEYDVNGTLVNLSDPAFDKFSLSLSASGVELPAVAAMPLGELFEVEIPLVLRERGSSPSRPAVAGSVAAGAGWVEYRPRLSCRLDDRPLSGTEGAAETSWTLQFLEA